MATTSITFHWELRDADADGSACAHCGDSIWLTAKRLVIVTESGKVIGRAEGAFCGSCADGMLDE